MSASLVGSEMCIRDRPFCIEVFEPHSRALPAGRRRLLAMQNMRSAYAVSYTHLTLPTICSV
eukprot:3507191-Alexandrium_andersonii.AAC.1